MRAIIIAIALIAGIAAPALAGEEKHFGAGFTKANTVSQADAMAKPDEFTGPVKIKGKVKDVCQREGCWLVLTDGEREMRVHMKDHGFKVPKDLTGKTVVVEGIVEKKVVSEAAARHLAEESNSGVDPKTIVGDQSTVRVIASGVEIE